MPNTSNTMAEATTLLSSLTALLPQLMSPPVASATLAQVSEQCIRIKQYGKQLEETDQEQLNHVVLELTKLCQESSLGLELRLRFLEIIELRSLGWDSNENLEAFYKDKFNEVVETSNPKQSRIDTTDDDDNSEDAAQEMIKVGAAKLFLSSTDKTIISAAKNQLERFFMSPSWNTTNDTGMEISVGLTNRRNNSYYTAPPIQTPSTHQYTRETLLMLATSQESQKAPVNWARRIQALPRVIVKQM